MELKEQDREQMLAIQSEGSVTIKQAEQYQCSQESDLEVGSQITQQINHKKKTAKAFFDYIKNPLNELKNRITTAEKLINGNYDAAKRIVADKMNLFIREREEEQRKEQERIAEVEREKQRKKIEAMNKRLERISNSQLEIVQKKSEMQAILDNESELSFEEAEIIRNKITALENLENKLTEQAEDVVIKTEEQSVPVITKPTIPKVKGMRKRTEIEVQITNKRALLQAVINGMIPEDVVDINIVKIKNLVKGGKKIINGCKITVTEGY